MSDEPTSRPWAIDLGTMAQLRLKKAEEALRLGDAEMALVEAEELLDDVPDHAAALAVVGEAALIIHDAALAARAFEQLLAQRPDDALGLEGLAVARFELVEYDQALEAARKARTRDPDLGRAWYYEGLVLERRGEGVSSSRCFEKAYQVDPVRYPLPRNFSDAAWEEALTTAKKGLPGPIRAFYANVPVRWEKFPDATDLTSHTPPLSPFSYALYEGAPPVEGDPWTQGPKAIRLFRGNLRQGVKRKEELERRIADALLREAAAWLGVDEAE